MVLNIQGESITAFAINEWLKYAIILFSKQGSLEELFIAPVKGANSLSNSTAKLKQNVEFLAGSFSQASR